MNPIKKEGTHPVDAPAAVSQVAAWPVIATLAQRELVRFVRQRNRVFGALVQPVIFWLLFSEGLKRSDLGYAHFFPGTIVMILLFTAIFATISIIDDRKEGFLQAVLVAPIPRWAMVLGKVLGGAAIAMLQAVLFLALGWTIPNVEISCGFLGLVEAIALMGLIAIALTALGFSLAWRMDSTQGFHAIMMVFLFPMWLLSGAFFPMGAKGILGGVVAVNPLTYGVAGLRRALQTGGDSAAVAMELLPSQAACWGVTILFATAMLAVAWRLAGTRSQADFR